MSATLLLVDDEAAIRMLLGRDLEDSGYVVVQSGDGVSALEQLRRRGDIALVVTDIRMPNMGGDSLVAKMREEGFRQPVVFISGYTGEIFRREGPVLLKPFDSRELLDEVGRLLQPV